MKNLSKFLAFTEIHNPGSGLATKYDVINYLATAFARELGDKINVDILSQDMVERERFVTTGIGYGIALPSAKSKGTTEVAIGVYRLTPDFYWESMDKQPVNLAFPIISPENLIGVHLNVKAKLSYILASEQNRQDMLNTFNTKTGHIDRTTVEKILNPA